MGRFEGRSAIVTGGASGIGLATATLLAREGGSVVICDRNEAAGSAAAQRIAAAGGACAFCRAEVTERDEVRGAVAFTIDRFGRLDLLVNNAAIAEGDDLVAMDEAMWDRNLAVVLKGPFLFTQAAIPAMLGRGGAIVNVASVNGLLGLGDDAYSAAKAGLINLTKNVAVRYGGRGIRANVICPGTVRTPIWRQRLREAPDIFEQLARWYPLGRVGEPEDIARAVLFLGSEEASWITGAVLPVDGGITAGLHRMAVELQGAS